MKSSRKKGGKSENLPHVMEIKFKKEKEKKKKVKKEKGKNKKQKEDIIKKGRQKRARKIFDGKHKKRFIKKEKD